MNSLTPEEEGRALDALNRLEAQFEANGFLSTDELNQLEMTLLSLPKKFGAHAARGIAFARENERR